MTTLYVPKLTQQTHTANIIVGSEILINGYTVNSCRGGEIGKHRGLKIPRA